MAQLVCPLVALQEAGNLSEAEMHALRLLDYGPAAKERAKALLREVRRSNAPGVSTISCYLSKLVLFASSQLCTCETGCQPSSGIAAKGAGRHVAHRFRFI